MKQGRAIQARRGVSGGVGLSASGLRVLFGGEAASVPVMTEEAFLNELMARFREMVGPGWTPELEAKWRATMGHKCYEQDYLVARERGLSQEVAMSGCLGDGHGVPFWFYINEIEGFPMEAQVAAAAMKMEYYPELRCEENYEIMRRNLEVAWAANPEWMSRRDMGEFVEPAWGRGYEDVNGNYVRTGLTPLVRCSQKVEVETVPDGGLTAQQRSDVELGGGKVYGPQDKWRFAEGGDAWNALNSGKWIELDAQGLIVRIWDAQGREYDLLGNLKMGRSETA